MVMSCDENDRMSAGKRFKICDKMTDMRDDPSHRSGWKRIAMHWSNRWGNRIL